MSDPNLDPRSTPKPDRQFWDPQEHYAMPPAEHDVTETQPQRLERELGTARRRIGYLQGAIAGLCLSVAACLIQGVNSRQRSVDAEERARIAFSSATHAHERFDQLEKRVSIQTQRIDEMERNGQLALDEVLALEEELERRGGF